MLPTPHCCAQAAGNVQFPPAGSHSPFLMFLFFFLFVMDGVMQCWPVALLMRATLPGPLPPKRTQQLAQSCTHISLVRSDSHVAVADMIVFLFRIDSLG